MLNKIVNNFIESQGKSLAANGYMKLEGGLIIQWGSLAAAINSTTTIAFPIAFPNLCVGAFVAVDDNLGTVSSYPFSAAKILSTSQFSLRSYYNQSGILNKWFAIGY